MSLRDELLPGSYKNISFAISRSSITGGRKDVKKQFPNSDRQLIEDLGLNQRVYNVDAIVSSDSANENYLVRRDNLLRVLEEGGTGVLVHPLYGRIENVAARSFSLIENFSSLGDSSISIVFEISDFNGRPTTSDNTQAIIDQLTIAAKANITADVADNFFVSLRNSNNYQAAVTKLGSVVESFQENITFLSVSADAIDNFTNDLAEFSNDIASLVRDPQQLAESIDNLFTSVSNLYATPENTFEVLQKFFNFGENDEPITLDTSSRIERDNNNNLINAMMQSESLVSSYLNASQITYNTVDDVEVAADTLDAQYQLVNINNSSDINALAVTNLSLSTITLASITDLRADTNEFFNSQKLTASQIITVETKVIPSRVLSYQYYADSSRGAQIAELNEDQNVTFIQGNVEIFTE